MKKTRELKNFTYFGLSEYGTVRAKNEDRYDYVNTVNGDLFIVCDGMGGVKGGEFAAQKAIESIKYFVSNKWIEDPKILLKNALDYANDSIINETKKYKNINSPGTTSVIVLLRESKIYYAHIGDSRIYYKTGKKIFRLTKDHSYVQNLVNKKVLTEEEAKIHLRRNEITKALGITYKIEPDICYSEIKPADDDYILLCSDGLSAFINESDIIEILDNKEDIEKKTHSFIQKAEDEGSDDNITVQLIHFYNTGRSKSDYDKEDKPTTSSKKLRLIGIITLLIFIIGVYTLMQLLSGNDNKKNTKKNDYQTYSKAYTIYSEKKDTLIGLYFENNNDIKNQLKKLNLSNYQIGYTIKTEFDNLHFTKLYIPVRNIKYIYPGENIFLMSALYKTSIENILRANNKDELFLVSGEKIIIPVLK